MAAQVHGFQTEVTKLLKLLANSLYSNKEIFLRELISNASDAVDKLRFLSIQDPLLTKDDPLFHIRVKADEAAGTLTISDNGIGMTLDEANEHLGTIAKSGTEEFFRNLSQDQAKASQLIGQFGVGFYSAFIVADRVTVVSRSAKAAANEAVRWTSDENGTYESELTTKDTRGTDVILTLKDSEKEFLNEWTLRGIITKYSDHISTPVWLWEKETPADEKKESTWKWVQVNDAKALWTLPPKDVKDEQYKEFYKHLTHDYDDPLTWAHNRVEGDLEYTSLLYIPKTAPWDLYNREQKNGLKLYVQRVFIMDNAEEFLPNYLRFVKGLVDTADLPLNVSREILQDSAVTRKLRRALTKRALTMIGKLAEDKTKYAEFWSQFGRVLKEGPVEDRTNQEEILKLLRFASTKSGTNAEDVSLTDYVALMPEKQKHIYYITAGSYEAAANSPYLETLKKKGIEVLLLWDRVDEWLMGNVEAFDGKTFISATAKDLDLGELEDKEEEKQKEESEKQHKGLVERLKKALGGKVQDVKVTARLVDSPACVVGAQDQMLTQQMRRMLEAAGQAVPEENYTLEINPDHPLIGRMATETDEAKFTQWANFIFAEAQLADQGTLKDPSSFIKSLNELLLK
jgi:molecular chaperone HtpG